MRVAALYDIHGNLPALDATLADIDREEIDVVLVGGDVSAGPFPAEALERCRALGDRVRWVRGNADRLVATGGAEGGLADAWCSEQLSAEQRAFLDGLPATCVLEVDTLGPVCFCHGSPRSDDEIITPQTPDERLAAVLAAVEQTVVVHGHTHIPYDRRAGARRIVCPGSVGMPYGETGAHWAIFGPDVAIRRTSYDLESAAARIRESGWPQAVRFAAENVLVAPNAEQAIEFFEQIASTEAGLEGRS
jgi:putative phosphoesterase